MTAQGDAWLSEMWATCRELTRAERMAKREADEVARALLSAPVEKTPETVDKAAS